MKQSINAKKMDIIGSTEYVDIAGIKHIPAKIDTGADTSAIWASQINIDKNGTLTFMLFDEKSPFFTGELLIFDNYTVKNVRSSHGDKQIRYCVKLPITIGGKTLETSFTLADRSRNNFPVLIGRHTIEGIFLVDVSKTSVERSSISQKHSHLNKKLQENPHEFHQEYYKNQKGIK